MILGLVGEESGSPKLFSTGLVTARVWLNASPPPVDRSSLVVGDMKPLIIECFGKLPLSMHCTQGGVHVKLLDVEHVPGLRFNLFSLHAVMPKCRVTRRWWGLYAG